MAEREFRAELGRAYNEIKLHEDIRSHLGSCRAPYALRHDLAQMPSQDADDGVRFEFHCNPDGSVFPIYFMPHPAKIAE